MKEIVAKAIGGLIALAIARNRSSSSITWSEVERWISTNANRDNIGRGYSGGRLPRGGSDGFAELVRETRGDRVRVSAAIVFDKRSGPVARHSWDADHLDAELSKMFAKNLRIRISV